MESEARKKSLIDTDELQREYDLKLSAKQIESFNKIPDADEFSFWVNDRMITSLDAVTNWVQNNLQHEIASDVRQLCLSLNDAVLMDSQLRVKIKELVKELLVNSVLNIRTPLGRNAR